MGPPLATKPSAFCHLAKATVPHMRPGSAIIATSSVNSDNPPLAPSEAGPPVLSMLKPMALEWEQIIVDAADPVALGRWWVEALGWVVVDETEEIIEIRPEPDRMPGLLFVPVPEGKTSKNRLHPDFRPDDQEAEVARLLSLGARRVDAVQDEQHWVTLLDPEGNEFCVLGERKH
ncbi:VOC family protein [Nonomuraea sp. NPDC003560]|uniref:VOC family protein n=1 Tax=Nonomuraea sp. NPDC003560 TaxID=3364341 RepID=UPI0036C17F68